MLCASLLAAAKILRQARQGRFFNSSGGSSIHSEMRSYPVELRGYEFLLGEIHRWRQVWRELFEETRQIGLIRRKPFGYQLPLLGALIPLNSSHATLGATDYCSCW